MKWEPGVCRPGDMIRVRLGAVYHYGVFVSEDEVIAYGLPPVEQYRDVSDRLKVQATDIDVFACGRIVEIGTPDRSERRKRLPPDRSIAAARARIGEDRYDLLHNNCEHFAHECVFGEHRSTLEDSLRERWRQRGSC